MSRESALERLVLGERLSERPLSSLAARSSMTLQKSSKVMPNFFPKSFVCAEVLALSLRKVFQSSAVASLTVVCPS